MARRRPTSATAAAAGQQEPPVRSVLADALDRVGDRWTLLVVDALLPGPQRFGELSAAVAGIAPNILADRLRRLEAEGLVLARAYSERPPRFAYELTSSGRELAGVLHLLADWGSRQAGAPAGPLHELCGTPLEARWYCPTCGLVVDEPDDDDLVHL